MSNTNNVPTTFGLHYRDEDYTQNRIVYVFHNEAFGGALWYKTFGGHKYQVVDDDHWLGPVPMPGEWVPYVGTCKCTFAQRMAGDGCEVCNPQSEHKS